MSEQKSRAGQASGKLGAYVVPGRVADPRPALTQAVEAERLGLGTVWISERWGAKDFGVLAGALSQVTSEIDIAAGVTHLNSRHPALLASMAMTTQALTGGRLIVGVGRSVAAMWRSVGLPVPTNQSLADSADIFRRLCRGEKVRYQGPVGDFPALRLNDVPDQPVPPLVLAAIGPRGLELAGRHFDGAILHPFLTPVAVARSVGRIRDAAQAAGRAPGSVRVYATVVVASQLDPATEAATVAGRAVSYYQIPGLGEQLARANGWDPVHLDKLRAHPQLADVRGSADSVRTTAQLAEAATALPTRWITEAAAVGTPADCRASFDRFLDAGADELILHGSTPDQLSQVVAAR
ncbi:TIGR03857 family LLM class F420-dependent oxidoreductase [Nocardia salmonicida]|uniref:TIGR03857 family LLM class F420-dependent oxidoreductase n=1 Tax=Nocardia salmonicida TaxID=53431 RepID=UPI0033D1FB86